jgi:hypothetical protein
MAKYTIFTDRSFNGHLNGTGPAWEEYVARGYKLNMSLSLVHKDWKPSGEVYVHIHNPEAMEAFLHFFPEVKEYIEITNMNEYSMDLYRSDEPGGWEFVIIDEVEIQQHGDERVIFAHTRLWEIEEIPVEALN